VWLALPLPLAVVDGEEDMDAVCEGLLVVEADWDAVALPVDVCVPDAVPVSVEVWEAVAVDETDAVDDTERVDVCVAVADRDPVLVGVTVAVSEGEDDDVGDGVADGAVTVAVRRNIVPSATDSTVIYSVCAQRDWRRTVTSGRNIPPPPPLTCAPTFSHGVLSALALMTSPPGALADASTGDPVADDDTTMLGYGERAAVARAQWR
jgi:hypothetical protein